MTDSNHRASTKPGALQPTSCHKLELAATNISFARWPLNRRVAELTECEDQSASGNQDRNHDEGLSKAEDNHYWRKAERSAGYASIDS